MILLTWLTLKFLLKSKDVLYQVSSELSEVNSFIAVFLTRDKKPSPVFQKFENTCRVYRVKFIGISFCYNVALQNGSNSHLHNWNSVKTTEDSITVTWRKYYVVYIFSFDKLCENHRRGTDETQPLINS